MQRTTRRAIIRVDAHGDPIIRVRNPRPRLARAAARRSAILESWGAGL
jgi:hypothetical protein